MNVIPITGRWVLQNYCDSLRWCKIWGGWGCTCANTHTCVHSLRHRKLGLGRDLSLKHMPPTPTEVPSARRRSQDGYYTGSRQSLHTPPSFHSPERPHRTFFAGLHLDPPAANSLSTLSQTGTERLLEAVSWGTARSHWAHSHTGAPHPLTTHPLRSLPRNHLFKEQKVTPWSLGNSLSTQNPVSHSPRLKGKRQGPIPERNKTLAQGPDFQGNQLARWGGRWGSTWTEVSLDRTVFYAIIHSSTIYSCDFFPSFNKYLLRQAR